MWKFEKSWSWSRPLTPEVLNLTKWDVGNYESTPINVKLVDTFDGEYLQNNGCTHLDGNIVDDKVWQERYSDIINSPNQYDLPSGLIEKLFVRMLAKEIDRVRARKWNMEKVIFFMLIILNKSLDSKEAVNIKYRIKQRILEWEEQNSKCLLRVQLFVQIPA